MVCIVDARVTYNQGRRIGFKPKSFRGYLRDVKLLCVNNDCLDLFPRLEALIERHRIGVPALRSVCSILVESREPRAQLESYLSKVEATPSASRTHTGYHRRHLANAKRAAVNRKPQPKALELSDPLGHLDEVSPRSETD